MITFTWRLCQLAGMIDRGSWELENGCILSKYEKWPRGVVCPCPEVKYVYLSSGRGQNTRPRDPGPEVIKIFSCSTQLGLKYILLINVKMPTIVGILTFISRINY